ncbi:MAG: tetratricopeptide repeat protein, partial [Gemmatimonadaceae bacterium]
MTRHPMRGWRTCKENSFQSIAFFEYSLAQLHIQRGDDAQAREAFERALTTDLSFYAAYAALGDLAMQRGDTAAAAENYRQAVDLRPADGGLRAGYALALIKANRPLEAVAQLELAIELEPYFAQP